MKIKLLKQRNGISLLEILVAVVILSVSLVLIIQSLYMGLSSIRIGTDYFKASLLIDHLMFETLNQDKPVPQEEANAKAPFKNFRYKTDVEDSALSFVPAKKVMITAIWPSGVKERKTTVSLAVPQQPIDPSLEGKP